MKDKEEGYDSSFWIEPMSSIPIKVEMRLQLNIMLEKVEGIEYLFKNLQTVMFPVMWFESVAMLPKDMASSLSMLVMMPSVMVGCGVFSMISGLLIMLSLFLCKINREKLKVKICGEKPRVECDYQIVSPGE